MPLLDWLERCALPEEARLADTAYAAGGRRRLRRRPGRAPAPPRRWSSGRTSRAPSTRCSPRPTRVGPAGHQRPGRQRPDPARGPAHHPERAYDEGLRARRALARRQGRTRYAVTPRFSLSCSRRAARVLRGAARATSRASWFTSHLNENAAEIAAVRELFGCDYARQLRPARAGRAVAACSRTTCTRPTASCGVLGRQRRGRRALPDEQRGPGQRAVPARRHLAVGVRVALGSDVGAGTGLLAVQGGPAGLLRQQLLGDAGPPPHRRPPAAPGHRGRRRCARVGRHVGDLRCRQGRSTPLWLRPPEPAPRSTWPCGTPTSPDDALAKVFALAGPADVRQTWVAGTPIRQQVPARGAPSRPLTNRGNGARGGVVGRLARPPDCRPCPPRRPRPTLPTPLVPATTDPAGCGSSAWRCWPGW